MFIETHEAAIRLSVFIGVFVLMAVLEALFPRRERVLSRFDRWTTNFVIIILNSITLRIAVPILASEAASLSVKEGWGILSLFDLPLWFEAILAIILLDMLIYWQHVLMHKVPVLWRLHKVHHADRDLDVTSGIRFHPIEIILSMLFKVFWVIAIGAPLVSVIIFEILLNAGAIFNHANYKLPLKLDRFIRPLIVTPDFHRVHHSIIRDETDSNYGFFLSVWDRMFGSYTPEPSKGHRAMIIGLKEHQDRAPAKILWCLIAPFRSTGATGENIDHDHRNVDSHDID